MQQGMARDGKQQAIITKIKVLGVPVADAGAQKILAVGQPHGHFQNAPEHFPFFVWGNIVVHPGGINAENIYSFGVPDNKPERRYLSRPHGKGRP